MINKKIIASLLISSALLVAPVPADAISVPFSCQECIDCHKNNTIALPLIVRWIMLLTAIGMIAYPPGLMIALLIIGFQQNKSRTQS